MKTILIIYPHWHPANLAGVHRPRLIGNYLKEFGWRPRVLTVDATYFEETPDPDFEKTFSPDFVVTRVRAFPLMRPRLVGDIGLRAFFQLYKEAKRIIRTEKIDFVWLPIPSFYNALLGRLLYVKTRVPYGIDYIDPWVRDISNQRTKRAMLSQWVAKLMEPIAFKKVSVISGVSTPYYAQAIERNFPTIANQLLSSSTHQSINPHTHRPLTHVAMPYGFDPNDHKVRLENLKYPWDSTLNSEPGAQNQKIWLYAGAFLPNSHVLMDSFFKSIAQLRQANQWDESIRLWFIGTGAYPAKRITAYAQDHGLDDIVFEKRERYPFLQVLNFLAAADTVMIIGSTEQHYTASKTFQALLSERPVLSVFHHESSAVKVMEDCGADQFTVKYSPEESNKSLVNSFKRTIIDRLKPSDWHPNLYAMDKYSAKESAASLVRAIEYILMS